MLENNYFFNGNGRDTSRDGGAKGAAEVRYRKVRRIVDSNLFLKCDYVSVLSFLVLIWLMFLNKLKSGLYCENDCGKRCGPSIAMPVLALASSHAQDHPLLFDVVTLPYHH